MAQGLGIAAEQPCRWTRSNGLEDDALVKHLGRCARCVGWLATPKGWTMQESHPMDGEAGMAAFQAAVYKSDKYDCLCVAFRGTYVEDIWSVLQDMHVLHTGPSELLDAARAYFQEVRARHRTSKIYVTGHSLGGFLAESISSHENVEGVGFCSPASYDCDGLVYGPHRPRFEVHLSQGDRLITSLPHQHENHISPPVWHEFGCHDSAGALFPQGHDWCF
jgi:hypothetical protein